MQKQNKTKNTKREKENNDGDCGGKVAADM